MYSVRDYGATGDGSDQTDELQAAIDACADGEGGTVCVPAGEYRTGTLRLESGVRLHLESGATLRGSADPADYVTHDSPHRSLLLAVDATDVSVTGRGTIHASGTEFVHLDRAHAPDAAADTPPSPDGPVAPHANRPERALLFYRCSNVLVRGVTIREAPHWTLHLLCCDEVDVTGIDVRNDARIPNSDGINLDMCRNAHLSDCTVETGDDAVCVKTSGGYDESRSCERVTVTNCTLSSRSAGIKLGSETTSDIRDCLFENCVVYGSNRGLGIQHRDAGDIERILFSNITVETRHHAGHWWGVGEPVSITSLPRTADTSLGRVRDVRLSDLSLDGEGSVVVYAEPDAPIRGLRADAVSLRVRTGTHSAGRNILDLRPTDAVPVTVERDLPAVLLRGVDDAVVSDFDVRWEETMPFHTHGVECIGFAGLTLDGVRARGADGAALALEDGTDAIVRHGTARPGTGTFLSLVDVRDCTVRENRTSEAARSVVERDA